MNREKFRQLTRKEKAEWILQYYGVTIAVVLAVLGCTVSLLRTVLFQPEETLNIMMLDTRLSQEICSELQMEMADLLRVDAETVHISAYLPNDPTSDQVFAVRLSAEKFDYLIVPEEVYVNLWDEDRFSEAIRLTEEDPYEERLRSFAQLAGVDYQIQEQYLLIPEEQAYPENAEAVKQLFLSAGESSVSGQ